MIRLRNLFIDGLLLAVPLIAVVYLLVLVVRQIARLFAPLVDLAPQGRWLGVVLIDIVAVAALALALVVLGALARSSMGHSLAGTLEREVLRKIPGFLLFKSVVAGFSSGEHEALLKPALVAFDDYTALGFIVEADSANDAMVTVFLPNSPTPTTGNVVLVPDHRVTLLDVPIGSALRVYTRFGLGMRELISSSRRDTSHTKGT